MKYLFCFYHTISFCCVKDYELYQIAFNHLSDINFRDFTNLYKKCTANPYSFLVINTTLASDNLLHFRKNLIEKI